MPSQSAQRSHAPVKKASRRVVLYVPDSFDPQIHLPEAMRHLADYARFLLHRINVGRVHLRRGNCLVYLKHDYLARFMPRGRLTAIRNALEDAGVIRVRKYCVPGELCFGYRLLYPHDQGFTHYHPTAKSLVAKIMAHRVKEFRAVRLPLHRELRRYVKAIRIDEQAALQAVQGTPFQRSAQVAMIRAIADGDYFTVADRFGRFHTNLTNLKASLRPFLRYRESKLVNLDIANSQPMVFCLLLVKLLTTNNKLEHLTAYEFPETSHSYHVEIDEGFLTSLSCLCPQNYQEQEEGVGGRKALPILHANCSHDEHNIMQDDNLQRTNNRHISLPQCNQEQEEGEGGRQALPILHVTDINNSCKSTIDNALQRAINRQTLQDDVSEFIRLCEQGILYDDLMGRLGIPARRRNGFKRLFFTQVFFGKNQHTGKVRELFAKDFPTVYQAINDLKRKDHRQLAYLLQAHESKLMIDIICRRVLDVLPGTFIATIHDSILTTPDKVEEVRTIITEEFQRVGLNPTIRSESY